MLRQISQAATSGICIVLVPSFGISCVFGVLSSVCHLLVNENSIKSNTVKWSSIKGLFTMKLARRGDTEHKSLRISNIDWHFYDQGNFFLINLFGIYGAHLKIYSSRRQRDCVATWIFVALILFTWKKINTFCGEKEWYGKIVQ